MEHENACYSPANSSVAENEDKNEINHPDFSTNRGRKGRQRSKRLRASSSTAKKDVSGGSDASDSLFSSSSEKVSERSHLDSPKSSTIASPCHLTRKRRRKAFPVPKITVNAAEVEWLKLFGCTNGTKEKNGSERETEHIDGEEENYNECVASDPESDASLKESAKSETDSDDDGQRVKAWKSLISNVVGESKFRNEKQSKLKYPVRHSKKEKNCKRTKKESTRDGQNEKLNDSSEESAQRGDTSVNATDNISSNETRAETNAGSAFDCGDSNLFEETSESDDEIFGVFESYIESQHSEYAQRQEEKLLRRAAAYKNTVNDSLELKELRKKWLSLSMLRHACPQNALWSSVDETEAAKKQNALPQKAPIVMLPLELKRDFTRRGIQPSLDQLYKAALNLKTRWSHQYQSAKKWCLVEGMLKETSTERRAKLFAAAEVSWLGANASEALDRSKADELLRNLFPRKMEVLRSMVKPSVEDLEETGLLLGRSYGKWIDDRKVQNYIKKNQEVKNDNTQVSKAKVIQIKESIDSLEIDLTSEQPHNVSKNDSIETKADSLNDSKEERYDCNVQSLEKPLIITEKETKRKVSTEVMSQEKDYLLSGGCEIADERKSLQKTTDVDHTDICGIKSKSADCVSIGPQIKSDNETSLKKEKLSNSVSKEEKSSHQIESSPRPTRKEKMAKSPRDKLRKERMKVSTEGKKFIDDMAHEDEENRSGSDDKTRTEKLAKVRNTKSKDDESEEEDVASSDDEELIRNFIATDAEQEEADTMTWSSELHQLHRERLAQTEEELYKKNFTMAGILETRAHRKKHLDNLLENEGVTRRQQKKAAAAELEDVELLNEATELELAIKEIRDRCDDGDVYSDAWSVSSDSLTLSPKSDEGNVVNEWSKENRFGVAPFLGDLRQTRSNSRGAHKASNELNLGVQISVRTAKAKVCGAHPAFSKVRQHRRATEIENHGSEQRCIHIAGNAESRLLLSNSAPTAIRKEDPLEKAKCISNIPPKYLASDASVATMSQMLHLHKKNLKKIDKQNNTEGFLDQLRRLQSSMQIEGEPNI